MVSPPPAPLELPQDIDDNGLPRPASRNPVGKLQERMHEVFAESISLAPPANGHGNGHGTNGHGTNGHNGHGEVEGGERAAIGSGRSGESPADDEA